MSLLITFRNSFAKGPPNGKNPLFLKSILQFEIKVQKCYRLVTGCQLPKLRLLKRSRAVKNG